MKHIILCADDYGQNPAISQAIIDLLAKKRLSATSCLTTSQDWPIHANWLKTYTNQADIGLHFNLTQDTPLAMPLKNLIIRSHLRQLDSQTILAECHRQIDLFEEHMGKLPDFIDGHQHIHQFPIIREALLQAYETRLRNKNAYIRCTYNANGWKQAKPGYLKELIIQWCGAKTFKKMLVERNIPHNPSFSGVYAFEQSTNYSEIFPKFLNQISDQGLIMCHPGINPIDSKDTIATSRVNEYQYFLSEKFLNDTKEFQLQKPIP